MSTGAIPPTGVGAEQAVAAAQPTQSGQPATVLGPAEPEPQDSSQVSDAAATEQISVPSEVNSSFLVQELTKYLNRSAGHLVFGGEFQNWLEGQLHGERKSKLTIDEAFIEGLAQATGMDPDRINESVIEELFGCQMGEEVEISTVVERFKFLTPQMEARYQICGEGLISVLSCDGIQWIDQAEGFNDIDIMTMAKNGDPEMYKMYLSLAWQLYARDADTPEEAMRRGLVARQVQDGNLEQGTPEEVEKYLYYVYLAGLDKYLTEHDIEIDNDLDFSDAQARNDYLNGLFAIFVENGDLPMNDEAFTAAYADAVGQKDVIDGADLARIAEWRSQDILRNPGFTAPEGGLNPSESASAEAAEEPAEIEEPAEEPAAEPETANV